MPTYRFPVVTQKTVIKAACTKCGRRVQKTLEVSHTINPFNKHADGTPKTREEVVDDVTAELKQQAAQFVPLCKKCQEQR